MKRWIHASNDLFDEETKRILRNADTSDWSKMQTEHMEDEINDAGGYDKYIAKEKKRVYSASAPDVHVSGCSFDFDLGDNYDEHYIDIAIDNIFEAMDMEVLGTDYRSVDYPGGKVYSQCGIDFKWKDYYNEAEIEEDLANMIDEEGGNFFGIDFYSLED